MRIQRTVLWSVLLGLSLFFGAKGFENFRETQRTPLLPAGVESVPVSSRGALAIGRRTPPESAYVPIVRNNLFSPDREPHRPAEEPQSEPAPDAAAQPVPVSRGDLELFGVIQMASYEAALLKDAQNSSAPDGRLLWVKKGDRVGGLEVKEIFPDSVVLQEGEERVRIVLYDKRKTLQREEIRNPSQPTVVRTGPSKPAATPAPSPPKAAPKAASQAKGGYVNPFSNPPGGS